MSQEAKAPNGVKYLIYADLLPGLAEVASLGHRPREYGSGSNERGGLGWAANFVIRQFTQDAVALLSRNCTEVAKFCFKMNGFRFEIRVTAPTGSPEAENGLAIDPRSLFSSGVMMQATLEPSEPTSQPSTAAPKQLTSASPASRHDNPKVAFMGDLFS